MIIGVTGPKGAGKSTVLLKVAEFLSGHGFSLGGVISQSRVQNGFRVGYQLRTVAGNLIYPLATKIDSMEVVEPPGMRRYGCFLFDEENLKRGNQAISDGMTADYLFVDEIGMWETYGGGWHDQMPKIARRDGITFLGVSLKVIPHLLPLWNIAPDRLFILTEHTQNNADAIFRHIVIYLKHKIEENK